MLKLQKIENVLLFLTLLFLPTQLGRHFWPNFSYIYSLKIDYLSPVLYFWDILAALLLLVWILQKPKVNKISLTLFLFFLLSQLVSLLGADNLGAGLVRAQQYTIAGLFGIFLASSDFKSLSKKIFLPLLLGILGESLLAVLQVIKGSTLGLWILGERSFGISTPGIAKFDFYGMQFLRPYGTFSHPNVLAGFLILSLLLVRKAAGRTKAMLPAALLLAGLTVFLTMSRTVILAGSVMLLILLKKKLLVFAVLLLLLLSPILFARFSSLFNFDYLTLLRRGELIGSAWQIFIKHPVFGTGLNNFIPEIANNLLVGPSRFLQPVHNIFLLVLSETGLIGLTGFMLLIGYPLVKIIKSERQMLDVLPWVIILFLGMFDHYFLTLPQGYRMLFLAWGLSLSMLK